MSLAGVPAGARPGWCAVSWAGLRRDHSLDSSPDEVAPGPAWSAGCIGDAAAFAVLRPEWDALHDHCLGATPFSGHAWLSAWWAHYGDAGQRLRVVWVRRDGELVAAAPLLLRRRWGLRVLAAIGEGQSDYGDVLVHERWSDPAAERLAAAVRDTPGWQVLQLSEVRPTAAAWRLVESWPGTRWELPASVCLQVPGPALEQLLAGLTSGGRHRIRWKLRRIDELGLREREVPSEEVPAAVGEMLELHCRQWAGRGMNPEHGTARFRAFLTEAVAELARRGRAHVYEYRQGETLVASDVLLICPEFVGDYLNAAAPELRARIDTATLCLRRNLALTARLGVPLNLMRGQEDYKSRWRPSAAVNRHLVLARSSSYGACYVAALRGRRAVGKAVRARRAGPRAGVRSSVSIAPERRAS